MPAAPDSVSRDAMSRTKPQSITTSNYTAYTAAVRLWFEQMERYCASGDYDAAERIFADDVVWFGDSMDIVCGRSSLRKNRWERTWGSISNLKIDLDNIHAGGSAGLAWGMATWTSVGFDGRHKPFYRPGRTTVTLERRSGVWVAVHIHSSLYPGTPHRSFGANRQSQATPHTRTAEPE